MLVTSNVFDIFDQREYYQRYKSEFDIKSPQFIDLLNDDHGINKLEQVIERSAYKQWESDDRDNVDVINVTYFKICTEMIGIVNPFQRVDIIDNVVKQINEIINDTFSKKMIEHFGTKIIVGLSSSLSGFYHYSKQLIFVNLLKNKGHYTLFDIVVHEMGHHIDNLQWGFNNDKEWKQLFKRSRKRKINFSSKHGMINGMEDKATIFEDIVIGKLPKGKSKLFYRKVKLLVDRLNQLDPFFNKKLEFDNE